MVNVFNWSGILLVIFLGVRYPGEWSYLFPLLGVFLVIFRLAQDEVAAMITLLLAILLGGLTLLLAPVRQIPVFIWEIILLLVVNYIFSSLSQKNAQLLARHYQMRENQEIRINSLQKSISEMTEKISDLQVRKKYYSGLENFWYQLNSCLQIDELKETVCREIGNIIPLDRAIYYDIKEAPSWLKLSEDSEPQVISDCRYDRRIEVSEDIRAIMIIPLKTTAKVPIGYLLLLSRRENNFSDQDRRLAGILGKNISLAMQNILLLEKTEQLAITDFLTGLYNRRYFQERLEEEINRAKFYSRQLVLAMIDIDHFKKINDTYGHATGDFVLRQLSNIFRQRLRETDFLARYGGEEFVIILPRTSLEAGFRVLEDIRQHVEKERFYLSGENRYFHLTISSGVASLSQLTTDKPEDLIDFSDKALYQAKLSGRNRTVLYVQTT